MAVLAIGIAAVLPCPAVASAPAEVSTGEIPAPARIRDLLDDGRFSQAEALAPGHLAACESVHGADSIEVAGHGDDHWLELARRWRNQRAPRVCSGRALTRMPRATLAFDATLASTHV